MSLSGTSVSQPRCYLIPLRVLIVTFIVALLSFAISLLLGIGGVLLAARLRGAHPDLTIAYKYVALPAAGVVAAVVLVSATFMEVRHWRRAKTLARMEHQIGP